MRNLITAFLLSLSLLIAFRDGATTDEALIQSYGFNIDGPEQAWRHAFGAQSPVSSAQPSVQPTPTFIPTSVPISNRSFALQGTVAPMPTSTIERQASKESPPIRNTPPLSLTLTLLALCCALLLVIGVFVLGFVARTQNIKAGKNDK